MDPLGNPLELVQERKTVADGTGLAVPARERSTVK
jgi:hypothetical protein